MNHPATILLVDDNPDNLDLLRQLLSSTYKVKIATRGEKALQIARTAPAPDLILLDIMMPGMDGHEVIRQLKLDAQTQDIPVIFVTAIDGLQGEAASLELGAVDYITKPFDARIVLSRISTHLALRQAKLHIEQQNQYLRDEKELVEGILKRMQQSHHYDPAHLRALLTPVEETNGDILLSAKASDGQQWVLVGDMTGHGLPAAMACPLVSYVFYRAAEDGSTANAMLAELNDVLYEQLPLNLYMAGILVEISVDRRHARLWNAGMPDCLLKRDSAAIERLGSSGVPFGISGGQALLPEAQHIELATPAHLYLFSDGVTEVSNPAGDYIGIEGIENFLASFTPSRDPLDTLHTFLGNFAGGQRFKDDITFVEIELG